MSLMPRKPVPALSLDTVGGRRLALSDLKPEHFIMAVFYRGYHCPVCRKYLTELDGLVDEFSKRGVARRRRQFRHARACRADDGGMEAAARLNPAYGLPVDQARRLGTVHLDQPRQDEPGYRGAGDVLRARPVPRASGRDALLE